MEAFPFCHLSSILARFATTWAFCAVEVKHFIYFLQTFLKELLREIGNYNVKNPHKNMWELKPEYRHHENQDKDDSAMDSS